MAGAASIVIVGAGQAGAWAAATLRDEGFEGRVVLIGDENHVPYERPPLSKEVLAGDEAPETTHMHDRAFYDEKAIELRLGITAEAIDLDGHRVRLSDGDDVAYDKLVLATGARARQLPVPGADLAGVHTLRGIDDMAAIRSDIGDGAHAVIIGGGYIGLEVAATARKLGCRVTVLEAMERVMNRVVAPEIGEFYADVHRQNGVEFRLGVGVEAFEGDGRAARVRCADGTALEGDLFIVGVGAIANVELAEAAGLAVDNGIVVDEFGRTSNPDVVAAGDVSNHPNPILGRRVRLESWQNAQNQAIATARALVGDGEPYAEVPWFWSSQYDLNLQMVGLPDAWDTLVWRGDKDERKFSVFYLADGVMVGANCINSARDVRPARTFIGEKRAIDPAALADTDRALKKLL
jgi:3-phenylpropionate/trans-cinnamate dioxygenase ferredoxin reductase component